MAENINNSHETELGNCDQFFYNEKGQRWHLTLGLPSTSIFVAYRNGKRTNPYEQITTNEGDTIYAKDEFTSDDYVFLMTADIRVIGDVYDLKYSQGKDNGVFYLDGNQYSLGDEIPTLLAIYQGNSTVDYDIRQTH